MIFLASTRKAAAQALAAVSMAVAFVYAGSGLVFFSIHGHALGKGLRSRLAGISEEGCF